MRAHYIENGVQLIVEMSTLEGTRTVNVHAPDGSDVSQKFKEALDASCAQVRAASIQPIEEAFSALLEAMTERSIVLERLPDRNMSLSMTLDMATGTTEIRFASVEDIDQQQDIANSVARSLHKAMKEMLGTKPDKLLEAIKNSDLALFMESLTIHPPIGHDAVAVTLDCVKNALTYLDWSDQHAVIAARGAYVALAAEMPSVARGLLRQLSKIPNIAPAFHVNAQIMIGNSYALEGRHEVATEIYQSILDGPLKSSESEDLAWVHHNLGSALFAQDKGDKKTSHFRESGIAHFRQAATLRAAKGMPNEPANTLGTAAHAVERIHVRSALTLYYEIANCVDSSDEPSSQRILTHAMYSAARIACIELHQFEEAMQCLSRAKPFIRMVHEDADIVAGAMVIEDLCYAALGDHAAVARSKKERAEFLRMHPDLPSAKLEPLLQSENSNNENDALTNANVRLLYAVGSLDTTADAEISDKVEMLLDDYTKCRGKDYRIRALLISYVAQRLCRSGHQHRALTYYLRATAEYPGDIRIRQELASCLQKMGRLDEALEVGLSIARDEPGSYVGFLIAGASAYKNAQYGLAERLIKECVARKNDHQSAQNLLKEISGKNLDRIIQTGTTDDNTHKNIIFAPTTPSAFLSYLRDFVTRARMNSDSMWKSRKKESLVENPENAARALLAQDLAATSNACAIYKESMVTGGRIDFIANVLGAEFIVELKICGAGYSKGYAEGGFDQLKAYLREKNATRGYLVVFDARVNQSGADAIPSEIDLGDGIIAFGVPINIRGVSRVR